MGNQVAVFPQEAGQADFSGASAAGHSGGLRHAARCPGGVPPPGGCGSWPARPPGPAAVCSAAPAAAAGACPSALRPLARSWSPSRPMGQGRRRRRATAAEGSWAGGAPSPPLSVQPAGSGLWLSITHRVKLSRSMAPLATDNTAASAASTPAVSSRPLSTRVISSAACPMRLFPSTKGWFWMREKPSAAALAIRSG